MSPASALTGLRANLSDEETSQDIPEAGLLALVFRHRGVRDCRDVDVFARCGIALARFHVAAQSFPDASLFDERAWETEWAEIGSAIPLDDPILLTEYERIDAWLRRNSPLPGGKGLTHGDTNVLNFIDDGDQVSEIDVDSPMLTWYAIDLTCPVRNSKTMTPDECVDLWEGLMSGYRSIRPIDLDSECVRWILREWMLVDYVSYSRMPNPEQRDYLERWYSYVENPNLW